MNRHRFGIALLVLLLGLGLGASWVLNSIQQPVIAALETAAEQALSADPEAGIETARQARILWDRNWHGIAAISSHSPMEEIDSLFAQLPVFAGGEHWVDFSACCARLAKMVEAIGEAQSLSWWSLL